MADKVVLKYEKATKNQIRFKEESDGPPKVGTLYLPKWYVKDHKTVTVTLELGD